MTKRSVRLALLSVGVLSGLAISAAVYGAKPSRAKSPAAPVSTPKNVLVAAIQAPSRMGDVAWNSEELIRLTEEAASAGAKIVVLPEASITGYLSQDLSVNWHLPGWPIRPEFEGRHPADAAETVPGPTTKRFGDVARRLGIYLVVPFVEVEPKTGKYFNTAVLLDPEGRLALHYRKINPWPYPEDSWASKGDRGLAYIDTPYGRVGLLICFDVHTLPARLAKAGVEILLYPIAWVDSEGSRWFDVDLPRIAKENGVAIIGANWSIEDAEKGRDWVGYGKSRIIDAKGRILAKAKTEVGAEILYSEIPVGASVSD